MNKRIKIIMYFIFIIIIFNSLFSFSLSAQNSGLLNFHSITANGENQMEMINVAVPLIDKNINKIYARLNNEFFIESNGGKINSESLSIITTKKEYPLKNKNIEIFIRDNLIKHNNEVKVLLQVAVLVKPEYYPGSYQNELIISQKNKKGEFVEIEIPVRFEVEPWIEMKINSDFHEISQTNLEEEGLESMIPGQIEIRSNCSWSLFVRGEKSEIIKMHKLNIEASSNEERIEINQKDLNLRDQKVLLASAKLRKDDFNKPLIINFEMNITKFQEIKAGSYKFPVYFQLEVSNRNF